MVFIIFVINLIISMSSTPRFSRRSHAFNFPRQNFLCLSFPPETDHILPIPSSFISRRSRVVTLFLTQFSPASSYLLLHRPYLPQQTAAESFLSMSDANRPDHTADGVLIQGYYKTNRYFQRYVVSKPLA